ncbi:MAG: InlB B-repeat-containing protein, partial [Eggerthellaceae bacterium]|nr:InlB B-repeat-containing protein [Eggerthellaceae bacterium]
VVNVYYDRNEYTLQFQVYDYTYTATTGNNGTQYGIVDGEYVELTRYNGAWYYYDYGWQNYTGTRYTRSRNQSWQTIKSITALYGQSISDNFPIVGTNGVTYDSGERWKPQNSSTYNQVLIYIDIMPAESVTFHLDTATHSTKYINYYVEALPGQTADVTYNGKSFVLHKNMSANYGFFTEAEDYLDFVGFTKYGYTPSNAWGSGGASTVNCYYTRNIYSINFMDGAYVDGNGNPLEETSRGQLHEIDNIAFGADLTSYNSGGANYYTPTAPAGYVFEGWYIDSACTHAYDFTTMPDGGVTVYAKWRQIQYRVFLHPNAGTDSTLDWGSETQAMNFRVSYGGKISVPTGQRTGYEFYGWYTDEACTHAYSSATVLNDSTVTTPYDKTTHMTDPMDKWGNGATTNGDTDRPWITREFNLYAKWSAIIVGADGIRVTYDAGEGTNPPSDTALYKDNSFVSAGAAATAPANEVFDHWVLQTWNGSAFEDTETTVVPGQTFTVLKSDARITEAGTETVVDPANVQATGHYDYVVRLRAVYKPVEEETPTHIDWYSNYGSENGGKGTLYRSNTGIKINEAVDIYSPAPTRPGYTFKGWTKTRGGTTADFLIWTGSGYTDVNGNVATKVAADEKLPYEDVYAVWEESEVTINYAVASDSTGMGTVSPTSETVKAATGTAAGSTATAASDMYIIDYWTVDDGTEAISTDAHFTPDKNSDGIYEAHTYYAHFKLNKATVTVHHYLLGTTTKVADDVTSQEVIGTEYTAQPVTTYQGKNLTINSYDPSQTVTVSVEGNVITIYYTLPLTITAKTDSKTYDGNPLNGAYTITGALEGDVTAIETALGTAPSITNVSESQDYLTEDDQAGITGIPSYYVVTYTPGTLTINPRTVTVSVENRTVEYNGSEQYGFTEAAFDNVVSGHTATIDYAPSHGTSVNTYNNGVYTYTSFAVEDASGNDVTSNYTLGTQTTGTLTITKSSAEIVVTAGSG